MKARFWIGRVTRCVGSAEDGKPRIYGEVELNAVQRSTEDNVDWAHYTPVGKLTMTVHPEAREWFEQHQGKDVYIEMSVVDSEAAGS